MSDDHGKKIWYLRRINLLASMTDEEIDMTARLFVDQQFPAGVELLGGRQPDQVYLVKEGAVRLYGGHPRQVTLALLSPGRLFGRSYATGDDIPKLGAVTLVPSYLCFATGARLLDAFVHHPEVMLQLTRALAEQVFRTAGWLERIGVASPRSRLASLLVELGDEFGEPVDTGRRIPFRLTRADLAGMVGVSRETASRLMTEFGRAGWAGQDGGLLLVRDREALAAQANAAESLAPENDAPSEA